MKLQSLSILTVALAGMTNFSSALNEGSAGHKNIFGQDLDLCSTSPLTGYWRDGYCKTNQQDQGTHTVCAELTQEFLDFTKAQGNDLSTPRNGFPGLKPGDRWCLCASRWLQAQMAGKAPRVHMAATHENTLGIVDGNLLEQH